MRITGQNIEQHLQERLGPIEALREAAHVLEHYCEFNDTVTSRWSGAAQRENNRRISRARLLREQADEMEKSVSLALAQSGL